MLCWRSEGGDHYYLFCCGIIRFCKLSRNTIFKLNKSFDCHLNFGLIEKVFHFTLLCGMPPDSQSGDLIDRPSLHLYQPRNLRAPPSKRQKGPSDDRGKACPSSISSSKSYWFITFNRISTDAPEEARKRHSAVHEGLCATICGRHTRSCIDTFH